MLPEEDLDQIRRWLAQQNEEIPEHVRDQMRIELDTEAHAVVIFECRPPWKPDLGPDWTRRPIARLRYTKRRNGWTLYWFDSYGRHQRYDGIVPDAEVSVLLEELDNDPTAVFWG